MKKMLLALGLSGALLGGSVTWAEEAVTAPTPSEQITVNDTVEPALTESSDIITAETALPETLVIPLGFWSQQHLSYS